MDQRDKIKKVIRLIVICFASILIIGLFSTYMLFHNYISKINIAKSKELEPSELLTAQEKITESLVEDTPFIKNETEYKDEVLEAVDNSNVLNPEEETEAMAFDEELSVSETTNREIEMLEAAIEKNRNSDVEVLHDKKVLNILLIGSDTRNINERGRSDTMILITLNKNTKKIIATSFLRDIYLSIPNRKNNRLNAAFAYGGADLLMDTMEQNFKIQVDRYIMVDFYSFIDIVDTIGGITMEIEEEELDDLNRIIRGLNVILKDEKDSDQIPAAGKCVLNGKQALSYARNRTTGNGDFERTNRQRKVLTAIFNKVKKQDILILNKLLNIILPKVTTNFSEVEILEQLLSFPSYIGYDLEQWSIPMSNTYSNIKIENMSVLGIDFDMNIAEIKRRLYSTK
ncbi:LCP family protein [Lachnospiraceae bacterium MD1]|uniref:LCP family protein n=1 Tax=Variimorphobacter saccharofermentans TaxID=2755051 RepID=A0A839K126_9FIRM|nr:LCP family protein [Variimorphobacter saccharofermentans]MBB2182892.1 LCP family protein [Variimorphobacter saccharofermentans]